LNAIVKHLPKVVDEMLTSYDKENIKEQDDPYNCSLQLNARAVRSTYQATI
jgi:hypothetical protein